MEEPEDGILVGTTLTVRVLVDTDKPIRRLAAVRPQGETKVHYFDIDYFRLPRSVMSLLRLAIPIESPL